MWNTSCSASLAAAGRLKQTGTGTEMSHQHNNNKEGPTLWKIRKACFILVKMTGDGIQLASRNVSEKK